MPRERTVTARHHERVLTEIAQAKHRLGLPETAPVVSGVKPVAKASAASVFAGTRHFQPCRVDSSH